jgi:hypothetical protein
LNRKTKKKGIERKKREDEKWKMKNENQHDITD